MTSPQATQTSSTTTWKSDPAHSSASFSVRHMMIATVRGRFGAPRVTVETQGEDALTARIRAEIDATAVDTGEPSRDAHLRSPDFFDVERFPTMTFESRAVEPVDDDRFRVVGDLTIRDITHEVVLDVEREGEGVDPWGQRRIGLVATTVLDRTAWNLTWNQVLEAGGVLVGDKVKVTLDVQLLQA